MLIQIANLKYIACCFFAAFYYYAGMTDSLRIVANTSSSLTYVPAPASTLWLYLTVSSPEISNSTNGDHDEVGSNIDTSQIVTLGNLYNYTDIIMIPVMKLRLIII